MNLSIRPPPRRTPILPDSIGASRQWHPPGEKSVTFNRSSTVMPELLTYTRVMSFFLNVVTPAISSTCDAWCHEIGVTSLPVRTWREAGSDL